MKKFMPFTGTVTMISDFNTTTSDENSGCYKLMSVDNGHGSLVNFVVAPTTYFVDQAIVSVGDIVTGYYDASLPVIMIYPPQYRAVVMVKETQYQSVKVDYFNSQFVSSDGTLQLSISPYTPILLENGQPFTKNPSNRYLIVVYGASTKSIPAMTSPNKIIVMCKGE